MDVDTAAYSFSYVNGDDSARQDLIRINASTVSALYSISACARNATRPSSVVITSATERYGGDREVMDWPQPGSETVDGSNCERPDRELKPSHSNFLKMLDNK